MKLRYEQDIEHELLRVWHRYPDRVISWLESYPPVRDHADAIERPDALEAIRLRESIPGDLKGAAFWEHFRGDMTSTLLPRFEDMMTGSAQDTIERLPVSAGVDWEGFNIEAREWAREYTGELVRGVTDTTIKRVATETADWVQSREGLPALTRRIDEIFDDRVRAQTIAVTESTRAFAEANDKAWQASRVVEAKRWQTAVDERVCIICGPLHEEVREVGKSFARGIQNPPAHVNCRCWLVPVVAEPQSSEGGWHEDRPWEKTAALPGTGEASENRRQAEDWLMLDKNGEPIRSDAAKDELVTALSERSGVEYDKVNSVIRQWSHTSNDADMRSLSLQRDMADLIGRDLAPWQQKKIALLQEEYQATFDDWWQPRKDSIMKQTWVRSEGDAHKYFQDLLRRDESSLASLLPSDQQKKVLREMYDYTQERLGRGSLSGAPRIRMYRGLWVDREKLSKYGYSPSDLVGRSIEWDGSVMESWSADRFTAERFAGRPQGDRVGVVLQMDVPKEQLIGSARSGFGCLDEQEFVRLGAPPEMSPARVMDVVI